MRFPTLGFVRISFVFSLVRYVVYFYFDWPLVGFGFGFMIGFITSHCSGRENRDLVRKRSVKGRNNVMFFSDAGIKESCCHYV